MWARLYQIEKYLQGKNEKISAGFARSRKLDLSKSPADFTRRC